MFIGKNQNAIKNQLECLDRLQFNLLSTNTNVDIGIITLTFIRSTTTFHWTIASCYILDYTVINFVVILFFQIRTTTAVVIIKTQ